LTGYLSHSPVSRAIILAPHIFCATAPNARIHYFRGIDKLNECVMGVGACTLATHMYCCREALMLRMNEGGLRLMDSCEPRSCLRICASRDPCRHTFC
jgi:hypothetical protein